MGQAWLTAVLVTKGFHESRTFPKLAQLLQPVQTAQTPAQQRTMVEAIAQAFQLKIRRGKKKR